MPFSNEFDKVINLIEKLTGQSAPFPDGNEGIISKALSQGDFDFSRFNEIMLILGYDLVNLEFFRFLTSEGIPASSDLENSPSKFESLEHLEEAVNKFREFALLLFGNIKYAYRKLSFDAEYLEYWLDAVSPKIDSSKFELRSEPVAQKELIPPEDTFFLGYIIEKEIDALLDEKPEDSVALDKKMKMTQIRKIGKGNNLAYLFSDHLDVYVATSMRLPHEFLFISHFTHELFNHESLKPMKLRWFDPTQAYCESRIDKGLVEALMLKRASCTLYLAQESDTLGKDSELASTLAQGKPVIAYIPKGDSDFYNLLFEDLKTQNPDKNRSELVKMLFQLFSPRSAWDSIVIQKWLSGSGAEKPPLESIEELLKQAMKKHYDKRADTLKEIHPLGIQVNLSTGVANGVLVVRNIDDCAELIRRILTESMEFEMDTNETEKGEYLLLRERISGCVFRVMTGDRILTNCFWNYYLANE